MLIGLSQERMGEMLGLTFQQVQKYEKGVNRIGAGRLYQIADILSVPVSYFYEGFVGDGSTGHAANDDGRPGYRQGRRRDHGNRGASE